MSFRLLATSSFFSSLFLCVFGITVNSALLSPISKDRASRLYILKVQLKTPLFLDLGYPFAWVDYTHKYIFSSYYSIPCESSICHSLDTNACSNCFEPPGPGCANDTCSLFPENSLTRKAFSGDALLDSLAGPTTTDGRNPSKLAVLPQFRFCFACANTALPQGLPKSVIGVTGLGSVRIYVTPT